MEGQVMSEAANKDFAAALSDFLYVVERTMMSAISSAVSWLRMNI
jgi:hypothetical protein